MEVESRRRRFVRSRKLRPRGQRHHIFKNANSPKTSNRRKTTKVTKIVTVSDDGKETVKKFNHHDNQMLNNWNLPAPQSKNHRQNHKNVKKFSNHGQAIRDYDYQTNHYPHNPNGNQEINNHPPNPYPDFANPYPDGSYPSNSNFNPHPPNPPPHPIGEGPYPSWIAPKFKEYTTECCNTLNVSSSDTSNDVIRGSPVRSVWMIKASLNIKVFSEALGIYVFDRNYFLPKSGIQRPFYVKDTNDFVLRYISNRFCISRDLSLLNIELCLPFYCSTFLCPNYQDYIEKTSDKLCKQRGLWFSPNGNVHEDRSLSIECVGEPIKTPEKELYAEIKHCIPQKVVFELRKVFSCYLVFFIYQFILS